MRLPPGNGAARRPRASRANSASVPADELAQGVPPHEERTSAADGRAFTRVCSLGESVVRPFHGLVCDTDSLARALVCLLHDASQLEPGLLRGGHGAQSYSISRALRQAKFRTSSPRLLPPREWRPPQPVADSEL